MENVNLLQIKHKRITYSKVLFLTSNLHIQRIIIQENTPLSPVFATVNSLINVDSSEAQEIFHHLVEL